ncbi:hypothetical protein Tsp_04178 [Trichinella spiralis]|uniref:hypothetical protein n=1 Tax=Trichinella spiralis TaxID=6334 RepID=UPI0001EFB94D|nr:hypothetical protein Tsp_04178 [Trichinella spiralis]
MWQFDYAFRCYQCNYIIEWETYFASSNGSVMDPLLMPLRIGTVAFPACIYLARHMEMTIETVRLTGIQSLYILKMWQFDYAFRYYQCSIGKTDYIKEWMTLEVRISSSRRKDL